MRPGRGVHTSTPALMQRFRRDRVTVPRGAVKEAQERGPGKGLVPASRVPRPGAGRRGRGISRVRLRSRGERAIGAAFMGDIDDLDTAHHRDRPGAEGATDPVGQEVSQEPAERTSAPPVIATTAAQMRRRKDKAVGLGIVAATFGVSMLFSLWAKHASTPPTSEEPAPPTTTGLIGYPEKIDPLAALPLARELTKRPLLRGFVADGVSPKGLIDVRDKVSKVRFSFQSAPGQGAQPPRAPGTLPTRTYCGRQNVLVKKDGIGAEPDVASFPCGSKPPTALPEPRCRPEKLWALA